MHNSQCAMTSACTCRILQCIRMDIPFGALCGYHHSRHAKCYSLQYRFSQSHSLSLHRMRARVFNINRHTLQLRKKQDVLFLIWSNWFMVFHKNQTIKATLATVIDPPKENNANDQILLYIKWQWIWSRRYWKIIIFNPDMMKQSPNQSHLRCLHF